MFTWHCFACAILVGPIATTSAQLAYEPVTPCTLLRAGRVLDVHTGSEAAGQTVIVEGDQIVGVLPTSVTPVKPGDRVLDLTAYTVLPGLIDVHTHLTMANDFDPFYEVTITPAKEAILGVENAKTTLEAGFTTVRNVGANDFTDVALRDEINAGHIPGPHMQVSGPELGITGGDMDGNLLPYTYHYQAEGVANGIPAAHAHGAQAILWAFEAGVDSIEHGSYLDQAGIDMMLKHGTYLVPTAYLIDWVQQYCNLPALYRKR